MKKPTLYIFSGLPATGKSTLSRRLSKRLKAVYIRIDTVEQALKEVCGLSEVQGEGYRLSYRIAEENLKADNDVVADSVNPLNLTRKEWNDIATRSGASHINIEITCKDKVVHKSRTENRTLDITNLKKPTWEDIQNREYHEWTLPRIVIDTSVSSEEESFRELLDKLNL